MSTYKARGWHTVRYLGLGALIAAAGVALLVDWKELPNKELSPTEQGNAFKQPRRDNAAQPRTTTLADLRQEIERCPDSELRSLWDAIGDLSDPPGSKQFLYQILLFRLCEGGQIDQAVELVTTSFGEGQRRSALIHFIFTSNSLTIRDLCEKQAILGSGTDRDSAASGIKSALANLKTLDDLDPTCIAPLGVRASDTIFEGLFLYLERSKDENIDAELMVSQIIEASLRLTATGALGPDFMTRVYHEASNSAPFFIWNVIEGSAELETAFSLKQFVAGKMADRDPERATRMLLDSASPVSMDLVFGKWLKFDPKEADNWYQSNIRDLPAPAKHQIATAFSKDAASKGDFEGAWQWVNAITDPAQRKKAESQVWPAERDAVRRQSAHDPPGTIQALVSGESKHADYWLEEAMMTWIAKDPENAEVWYKKNWNSLPPAKSQYIAAAYAKEALEAGDIATARQWTNLIQDPKTKDRIATSIDKAQSTQGQ